jgi:hypothetical protein
LDGLAHTASHASEAAGLEGSEVTSTSHIALHLKVAHATAHHTSSETSSEEIIIVKSSSECLERISVLFLYFC